MINLYYLTDRALQFGFNFTLEGHVINHANSKINFEPNGPELEIEFQYINKILKELATSYARKLNQYKCSYKTVFSATIDKQDEDGQMIDQTELFIKLNTNQNLAESDINNINVRFQLGIRIQRQELKGSG